MNPSPCVRHRKAFPMFSTTGPAVAEMAKIKLSSQVSPGVTGSRRIRVRKPCHSGSETMRCTTMPCLQ